ncbi:hypothetical protein EHW65_18260 [Erwinia psidii]|uniref:hypothetical protein n=1 Tax=Erwinia psidii TaxID=69224 RepID=UPI00226B86E2|nr:hypothetical protein [Erwinia psidii]MCX8959104.1 hypothetical protein [Erwinia psidii]
MMVLNVYSLNLRDFPHIAKKMLNVAEWWICLTYHLHHVGVTGSVALTLEGKMKQRVSILITVAG